MGDSCPRRAHTDPQGSQPHNIRTLTHGHHTCTHSHRHAHTLTHVTPTRAIHPRAHPHPHSPTHTPTGLHTHTSGESERSGSLLHPPPVPPSQAWGGGGPGLRAGPRGGVPRSEASARGPGGAGTLTLGAQPRAPLRPACVWTPGLDDVQASSTHTHGFLGCGGAGGRAGTHR